MVIEEGSSISVDSELFSRSSFNATSVLHDDGHLNHNKMLEWALPTINTSRLRALAATSFPSAVCKTGSKSETSIPFTSNPVMHVSVRKTRKPKKSSYEVTTESWSLKEVEIQSVTLTGERVVGQNMKQIEVILIYRPPRGNDREALRLIFEFISKIHDVEKKDLLIMGDLNWDYLNTQGLGIKMIDELTYEMGLVSHISLPTRVSSCRDSLLDLMLSNMKNIFDAGCLDYALSDHYPVYRIFPISNRGPNSSLPRI